MGNQLNFMDCPTCGKRLATTARVCRHCGRSPSLENKAHGARKSNEPIQSDEDNESEAHFAQGGFDDSEDDFDYDEFIENEFPETSRSRQRSGKKSWVIYTAWVVLALLTLPIALKLLSLL